MISIFNFFTLQATHGDRPPCPSVHTTGRYCLTPRPPQQQQPAPPKTPQNHLLPSFSPPKLGWKTAMQRKPWLCERSRPLLQLPLLRPMRPLSPSRPAATTGCSPRSPSPRSRSASPKRRLLRSFRRRRRKRNKTRTRSMKRRERRRSPGQRPPSRQAKPYPTDSANSQKSTLANPSKRSTSITSTNM